VKVPPMSMPIRQPMKLPLTRTSLSVLLAVPPGRRNTTLRA
jgi:hypothetical protein